MTETVQVGALAASWSYARDPFGALQRLSARGDLVETRLFGWRTLLVNAPGLVEEVLRGSTDVWIKDALTRRMLPIGGVLTAEGEAWRRQRRMLNPAFANARYERYAEMFGRHLHERLAAWRAAGRVELGRETSALTLGIAVEAFFGEILPPEDLEEARAALAGLDRWLASPLALLPWDAPGWVPGVAGFRDGVARFGRLTGRILERRAGRPGDDLLGMMLAARDESGRELEPAELADQILTFLLAGHETSALTLLFALHLLDRHPEARARAEAEADALDGPPDVESLPRLPWIRAVIDESLRLYPPAWMLSREPRVDTTVGGHPVAAGTFVGVAVHALHRDPRHWPDPDRFDPGRFLGGDGLRAARGTYLPFGLGPRMCIGSRFALLELVLLLAGLLREVRVTLEQPTLPPLSPSITSRPKGPVWARVAPRGAAP
jgi:cytochrome P450